MKENKVLIKFLICMGILIFIILICYIFIQNNKSKNENKIMLWDTGKIVLINKEIQLPCSIDDFKNITGIEISKNNGEYHHETVKTPYYHETLIFDAIIENNYVIGIDLGIYDSEEKESTSYKLDLKNNNLTENELWVAENVIFPNDITAKKTIDEIIQVYGKDGYKENKLNNETSHSFIGNKFLMKINITNSNEITEISYYQINK